MVARTKLDPAERDRRRKLRAEERKRLRKLGKAPTQTKTRASDVPAVNRSTDWSEKIPRDPRDLSWLIVSGVKAAASRILNDDRNRPYFLSIHWPEGSGPDPCFNFHPCGYFKSGDRIYYSFAFSEHRNMVVETYRKELDARKETREATLNAHESR